MDPNNGSSQEILDQLLRDGKITDEDYLRLSKALAAKPDKQDEKDFKSTGRRKLHKSWKNSRLGGVCAGIADYFEIDPPIVRLIAVFLGLIAAPAVLIVYLILYYMMPWDDEAAAKQTPSRSFSWAFALWGALFFIILPLAFVRFLLPRFVNIYMQLGATLPVCTRYALSIARHLYGDLSGIFISLLFVALASLFYGACRNTKLRTIYKVVFFCLAIFWTLFLIIGTYAPLFNAPILPYAS